MSADNKKPFRFSLNGAEIEKLLKSVSDKMNADAITQDLKSTSISAVLSAAVTNEQLKLLRERTESTGVKKMLDSAPDVNTLTDELLNKINSLELVFIGSMSETRRDALDTSLFRGGEVILLLNNSDPSGKLQYWDRTSTSWKTASTLDGHRHAVTALTASDNVIQTFNKDDYRTATFTVSARTAGKYHVCHYTLGWEANSTIISSYGEIWNDVELFSLTTNVASGVEVKVTTTQPNTRIQIEVQSVY
ncbi:hypothetical protein MYOV003v1_p0165 [Vibrio phage 207E48.1]|nr:hypothetical protein MYOV003v1_p0165 [Vibrio phage 207E48.1]